MTNSALGMCNILRQALHGGIIRVLQTHFSSVFFPKIIIIYTPVNLTLLRIKLGPPGVLFARTCEGDVSKVNLPVFENSWFSKSHFVDVFFIL